MLIPVMYPSGKHDLVKDFTLDQLIDNQGIVKFKRRNGWIDISADNIRSSQFTSFYHGEERRQTEPTIAELMDIF
ncbi:MAG: hypothetical protein J7K90_00795 [Desulfuromusa sp.]|nr:hypothetical protein [Desulfuromusa sp.]